MAGSLVANGCACADAVGVSERTPITAGRRSAPTWRVHADQSLSSRTSSASPEDIVPQGRGLRPGSTPPQEPGPRPNHRGCPGRGEPTTPRRGRRRCRAFAAGPRPAEEQVHGHHPGGWRRAVHRDEGRSGRPVSSPRFAAAETSTGAAGDADADDAALVEDDARRASVGALPTGEPRLCGGSRTPRPLGPTQPLIGFPSARRAAEWAAREPRAPGGAGGPRLAAIGPVCAVRSGTGRHGAGARGVAPTPDAVRRGRSSRVRP